MSKAGSELSGRLGQRLRRARKEAGLELADMAERVGRTVSSVWRLEAGQVQDPGIRLIGRYLRACGKRWLEVMDILDDVEMPELATSTIADAELAEKDKARLSKAVRRQVERYAPSQAYPFRGRPRRIEDQQTAVRRFAEYRQAIALVEHDVTEFLNTRPVPAIDYAKYKAAARQALGRLWRGSSPRAEGKRQKTEGERQDGQFGKPGDSPQRDSPRFSRSGEQGLARQRAELVKKGLNPRLAKAVQGLVRRRFAQLRPRVKPGNA